jgi:hypothetical protein
MRDYRVAGTASRSVVGIMNEFTFLATVHHDNHTYARRTCHQADT